MSFKHCAACNSPRTGDACRKCGAPLRDPHPDWEWPSLPDIDAIRALAREVGYAIGVHGTLERDLDLIAVPWSEDAVSAPELAEHIARGINGSVLAPEEKPLGRRSCNIQIDGWFRLIDLSVAPVVRDREGHCTERPVIERDRSWDSQKQDLPTLQQASQSKEGRET
jgi:hypothetical protein